MNQLNEIWIVDDDHAIRWVLEKALDKGGFSTRSFESADDLLLRIRKELPLAIISDIRMPGTDGLAMLSQIQEEYLTLPVIIMTAHADLDRAVAAFQGGAFEYLPKPFDVDDAVNIVRRAVNSRPAVNEESKKSTPAEPVSEIIGSAPAMQEVFRAIGRLSNSNMTVLLTGESGTGKELVAHALHQHSPRRDQTFVALNTAAIPSELLESELFGHEKGAFTGATAQRVGRFEQADDGTLFLDEIGDMPAQLQTRLLRVLADGEFYRVGGHQSVRVNVRVIAATHQDLEKRVKDGDFREDLYHRLNVMQLKLPSLRERIGDVPTLTNHFLSLMAQELSITPKRLSPDAIEVFKRYDWPGNVRELENVCRRATIMAPSNDIDIEDLPDELLRSVDAQSTAVVREADNWEIALKHWAERQAEIGGNPVLDEAVPKFERVMISVALTHTRGRRQEAARLLGWGRNTLTRKIKELDLDL